MPNAFTATCGVLLLGLILLTSCENGELPENTPEQPDQAAPTAVEAQDDPAGTLQLGDSTYEFVMRACDFSGETDDMYQTVSGRGTTPAGETFDVFVSRNEVSDILMHTVSFQTGDVRTGQGTVFEAQRMRSGGTWTSLHGDPSEPLIQIDGNRLTASGTFANDATGEIMEGSIEATCDGG